MDVIERAEEEVKKAIESNNEVLNNIELNSAQEQTPSGPEKSMSEGRDYQPTSSTQSMYFDLFKKGQSQKFGFGPQRSSERREPSSILQKDSKYIEEESEKNRNQYQIPARMETSRRALANDENPSRKSSFCKDCGSTDHFRGNLCCKQPSNFTIVWHERKKENESRMEMDKEDYDSEIP